MSVRKEGQRGAAEGSAAWTIQRTLVWTTKHFAAKQLDAPRLTGELLLGHALGLTRLQLFMDLQRPLEAAELARFRALVQQRSARIPTQHLLGSVDFYGRKFTTDRRALIPRPETELLVEQCLARLPQTATRFLEIGPGSGVIAVSLLAERPALGAVAIELSPEAVALTRENANALGVAARLELRQGDLFAPLRTGECFDLLVANPPYVPSGALATLQPEVRDHDPRIALDGGSDGLALLRRLIAGAPSAIVPGGLLALEIGDDQGPAVAALMKTAGFASATISKDYAELDRMAFAVAVT